MMGVGLSIFGGGDKKSPIALAQHQADYATDVIDDCDFVIDSNEARATDALALQNMGAAQ